MRLLRTSLLVGSFFCTVLSGCNSSEKEPPPPPPPITREDSVEVNLTAKVKAIDHATRIVTLQDERGREMTFLVNDEVRRLNEVLPGDHVTVNYRAKLLAELRPPTPEEAADPISVVESSGRGPRDASPASRVTQTTRVVTTVAAVDVPNMLVTLRGPMGDVTTVRARKLENIQKLKVGDTIVITYRESTAYSLQKTGPG
jgi:NADPH-dependent 2,4-dienoyl-CoA reductase/sulfur reductase-like enzyme